MIYSNSLIDIRTAKQCREYRSFAFSLTVSAFENIQENSEITDAVGFWNIFTSCCDNMNRLVLRLTGPCQPL